MCALLDPRLPNIFAAWRNHQFEAVTFAKDELPLIGFMVNHESATFKYRVALLPAARRTEFRQKLEKAGLLHAPYDSLFDSQA